MATLDVGAQLTLVELAKRSLNGSILAIAEVLAATNEILLDALWLEANQPTSHLITRRNTLPSGTWRQLNAGVAPEASSTTQVVEPIGMLEAYSKADKALVELASDPKAFRWSEDQAFIEGLGQQLCTTLFYGDSALYPERFDGFATRMNSLSDSNVIGASGTGSDTTSIFIVQWGPNKVHLSYPRSHKTMGISAEDKGEQTVLDASSNLYQAYVTHFRVHCGLAVHDNRSIQRIANIEYTGSSNIFDEDDLILALNRLPYSGAGAVIYANKEIITQMDIAAKDKANVSYTTANIWGVPTRLFRGVPVRRCDAIVNTETAIS